QCIPGCHRWDYQTALQQTQTLSPFSEYTFNLEASFNDLQYEYVREVYTTSVPGFMSQIGGQFGFFLGLSIITLLQMILYGIHFVLTMLAEKVKRACSLLTRFVKPANNESREETQTVTISRNAVAVISRNSLDGSNLMVHSGL
ncbi:hypothetical protein Angca_001342, partial [Angiostrongylus cantonensis]